MKFSIDKIEILKVMGNIQGITGLKTNLQIHSCVFITAKNSEIIIQATDSETKFRGVYPANVESEGKIAINAEKFYEIVKEYPYENILIEERENRRIKIGTGKVVFDILGMDTESNAEKFDDVDFEENVELFDIDSFSFKNMIHRVVVITSTKEETRGYINGALFKIEMNKGGNRLLMVATDGNRLSKTHYDFKEDEGELYSELEGIIDKKGLRELVKFLDDEGNVKAGLTENSFVLKKESETVSTRLLEGKFPEYENITAIDGGFSVIVDRKLFSTTIRRMCILENYMGLVFKFNPDKLVLSNENSELGDSKEDFEIKYEGEPYKVAFNPRFFMDTLGLIDEENVVLHVKDEDTPCILEGKESKEYLTVIMPMRL